MHSTAQNGTDREKKPNKQNPQWLWYWEGKKTTATATATAITHFNDKISRFPII